MVRFSKYKLYNMLLGGVTLLRVTSNYQNTLNSGLEEITNLPLNIKLPITNKIK